MLFLLSYLATGIKLGLHLLSLMWQIAYPTVSNFTINPHKWWSVGKWAAEQFAAAGR